MHSLASFNYCVVLFKYKVPSELLYRDDTCMIHNTHDIYHLRSWLPISSTYDRKVKGFLKLNVNVVSGVYTHASRLFGADSIN